MKPIVEQDEIRELHIEVDNLKAVIKELRRRLRQDNAEIDRLTEELEKYKD
jgi:predicted  nucleic acid-binding Zn-ribbon protein